MLTVDELQRQREARARVNHETYKGLFNQVSDRVRSRAQNRGTSLVWTVPPFVMGRPLYNPSHAARYVAEKLRRGGFAVEEIDGPALCISWSWSRQRTPHTPHATPDPPDPPEPRVAPLQDASRSLEKLKARLRLS